MGDIMDLALAIYNDNKKVTKTEFNDILFPNTLTKYLLKNLFNCTNKTKLKKIIQYFNTILKSPSSNESIAFPSNIGTKQVNPSNNNAVIHIGITICKLVIK